MDLSPLNYPIHPSSAVTAVLFSLPGTLIPLFLPLQSRTWPFHLCSGITSSGKTSLTPRLGQYPCPPYAPTCQLAEPL